MSNRIWKKHRVNRKNKSKKPYKIICRNKKLNIKHFPTKTKKKKSIKSNHKFKTKNLLFNNTHQILQKNNKPTKKKSITNISKNNKINIISQNKTPPKLIINNTDPIWSNSSSKAWENCSNFTLIIWNLLKSPTSLFICSELLVYFDVFFKYSR